MKPMFPHPRLAFAAMAAAVALFGAAPASAQCATADRPVAQTLSGLGVVDSVIATRAIALCTRHEYRFNGRIGQRMTIAVTSPSGQKSMLTLVAPNGDKPADGAETWQGALPASGPYIVEIGTDSATTYTLRVSLR